MKQVLRDILATRLTPDGSTWLAKGLEAARPPVHLNTLLGYYAGAGRRAGKRALNLTAEEAERVRAIDPDLALDPWGADEAARALLLLEASEQAAEEFADVARACYEKGDSREQQSWLRALALLPGCERFLADAVDACRTNIIPLFESIACENPYPARYFRELNFNQLVMKSLFNEIALERIQGLEARRNPELSRMADDYVSEREAAGRSVPVDIWWVLAPHISKEALPRVERYLNHEDPRHRRWAALGLGGTANGAGRAALQAREQVESEPNVKAAIAMALSGAA